MSHSKERKEKICLNCNTSLVGRYCHLCGQENLEPKETVWHIVTHFFNDITHFDGKFFSTVKYLLLRPGFLSLEYTRGRRFSYLNPIRMYVFTSAFFFLIFFSLHSSKNIVRIYDAKKPPVAEGIKDWETTKTVLESKLKKSSEEDENGDLRSQLNILNLELGEARKKFGDTSTRLFDDKERGALIADAYLDSLGKTGGVHLPAKFYENLGKQQALAGRNGSLLDQLQNQGETAASYDSTQRVLPEGRKDGWFKHFWKRKILQVSAEYKNNRENYLEHLKDSFLHSFPQILFLSLPFFALILKLVYIRRKQFYYVDHGIFTIQLYCASFILLLLVILINELNHVIPWTWVHVVFSLINFCLYLYMLIYLYKAMRGFYKQGRAKTLLKYLIVCFLAFLVNLFLFILFGVISAINV